MCELRYLSVSGQPRSMGEAHGEEFREEIRDFVSRRIHHLIDFVHKYDPERNLRPEEVLATAERLVVPHRRYDLALWEELSGIARSAGLSEAELLIGNGLTDIRDYVLMQSINPVRHKTGDIGECTTFGATPDATGGSTIMGQTWDMHPDARYFLAVIRREPEGRPATLSLTTVGCLCLSGINSEGVGICTSNLVPVDAREGVNYLFTISRALSATSAHEAAATIGRTARLSGHDYIVADGTEVLDVETTATRQTTTTCRSGVRVHSNHYLDPGLRELAFDGIDISSSLWRRDHLDQAFRNADRPVDTELCWQLLGDATRGDGAVCNEDYSGEFGEVATAATVVIQPSRGTILACPGGSRLGERAVFDL